ncbi:MAG: DUF4214 domain-containing protein [Planctomycetia bacterium]|nr:DUF4214 domain-containing protein [Planctomycetia bacterium]
MLSVAPGEPEPAADISEGAWVKRLYLDVMGRPAANAETDYWTDRLGAGVTKTSIALSLINSRERRAAAVDDYYQKVLGRNVDPSGLEFWLNVWDATGGPEVVRASLIGSGEYFHKAGGTKQGAIQSLYNDLLRRTAVDSEENYWIDVMSRAALANVAYGFVTSDEFRLQAVDSWYHDYLHRDVDPGGGTFWVGLMRGGMSQAQAQASLLAGVEYARQPYFDVRDFGATANNGSDDTAAIQAAFNAADAAGHSLIYIPAGVFVVDNLRLYGDHLKISGPGTLKLKNASANVGVLTIDGDHNLVSYVNIDGNKAGLHTGRAEGLRVVGDDNRIFRVQVSNTYMAEDGISEASGQNFVVFGTGNRLTETRSISAGHSGYRQVGDNAMYRDIVSLNARVKGFNASGNGLSFTVDGGRFETNAAEHWLGVISFQIDPGPGNQLERVVLRNLVVNGPQNSTQATTNAAKIVLVNDLLIENSRFISTADNHSSLRFAEGMGRVTMRNVYLNRNLFMQQETHDGSGLEDPMEELYMERVAIGDGGYSPAYAMERIKVGKLTMVDCRIVGFWGAGIDWQAANNGYTRIDVSNTYFEGDHPTRTTYDIMTNGDGLLNPVKMTWNNVQRLNTGGGAAAQKP